MAQMAPKERQIPAHVSKHPRFKNAHDPSVAAAQLNKLGPIERLQTHKEIIRETATHTRYEIFAVEPASHFAIASTLGTIARAIWAQ